jgi:hypothetical protein
MKEEALSPMTHDDRISKMLTQRNRYKSHTVGDAMEGILQKMHCGMAVQSVSLGWGRVWTVEGIEGWGFGNILYHVHGGGHCMHLSKDTRLALSKSAS